MLDFHHPQFVTAARGVRLEVESCAHGHDVVRLRAAAATVDVCNPPCTATGSLVRPQFQTAAAVIRLEVESCAHDHDAACIPAAASAGDVSHLPC